MEPRIRCFAGRICPASKVLDMVQETLLVLATNLNGLRSSQALVDWRFQIIRRHCIKAFSHIRRELRRRIMAAARKPIAETSGKS